MMQISPIKRRKAFRKKPPKSVSTGKSSGGGAVVIDIAPYLYEKELREMTKKSSAEDVDWNYQRGRERLLPAFSTADFFSPRPTTIRGCYTGCCIFDHGPGDHYYNETLTLDRGKRSKREFYRRLKGLVVCAENHWHYE